MKPGIVKRSVQGKQPLKIHQDSVAVFSAQECRFLILCF